MTNPYAPPRAAVLDIADPDASDVPADRGTRLGATILDGLIFTAMVYVPFLIAVIFGGVAGRAMGDRNVGPLIVGSAVLGLAGFIVWCSLTIKYVKRNG